MKAFNGYELVDVDPAVQAEIEAARAASAPANDRIPLREFAARFTTAERRTIRAHADVEVQDVYEELMLATVADRTNDTLQGGMALLEAKGAIAAGRAAEILDW